MASYSQRFTVGFPNVPDPVVDVWRILTEFLKRKKCLPKKFSVAQLAGRKDKQPLGKYISELRLKLTAEEVERLIIDREQSGFSVSSGRQGDVGFQLNHRQDVGEQTHLWCTITEDCYKATDDWSNLIEGLMVMYPSIGGWQWERRYWQWQTAPILNESYIRKNGAAPDGIRTFVQKGVPGWGPDRIMIDTSLNPGRPRELVCGISFYPTAEMWLGPHFWQYAKCTKEEVMAADFFLEKRDTPNFLYLKCWPTPFTRPDGEQGRMQQRLWQLFFHEDCEWPPGSGGICDEPMYGPPELMPGYHPNPNFP